MFTKNVLTSSIQGAGFELEYLVIAGGGGGGGFGGGGAGGYRTATSISNIGVAYTVTVGAGGSGASSGGFRGSNGVDSVFSAISSAGGGTGGANSDTLGAGVDGGSGGGGGALASSPYTGQPAGSGNVPSVTPSQGNDGGANGSNGGGGGGGGAGAVGGDCPTSLDGGPGGDGASSVLTGTNVYRAGGGGGGGFSTLGTGGIGGGGNGGKYSGPAATAGTANTGGGGGGGYNNAGGAGGSGVVIIKVPRKIIAEFSAGVSYNYIPVDGFHVYEITGAGVSDTVTFKDGSAIPVTIDESLRFNDDDSAYLTRTATSASDRRTFTWSGWVKRGSLGTDQFVFGANSGASVDGGLVITSSNTLGFTINGNVYNKYTSAVFRDTSAWYHFVIAFDTTQTIAENRIRIYINGKEETDYTTQNSGLPPLNYQTPYINTATSHTIGRLSGYTQGYFDGYLADVYFIDGQALDPSNFGHADDNGVWQPIAYPGTYGTNGFHLEFADNSTAAALGTDTSGNGNNWTPSGITTDDQMADTPSANHCTWNPLDWNITYTADGNLRAYNTLNAWQMGRANFGITTGKWYWEAHSPTTYTMVGIALATQSLGTYFGQGAASWGYYNLNGAIYRDNTSFTYGATWGASDVIGIAFDADTGQLTFYKNGVSQGLAVTVTTGQTYFPAVAVYNSGITHNFGQRPFTYTPPTGFVALSSANLPTPTIADGKEHFDIALYTGDGGSQNVRGFEFQPDFVWVKERTTTEWHQLYDALRGTGALFSNETNVELTLSGISFLSNGFTASDTFRTNQRGLTYVGWAWNAGGSTASNTDGSITTQVRANTTAGFSIFTYTGTGGVATVGHGLGAVPAFIIIKERSPNTDNWNVYHESMGNSAWLQLNLTNAKSTGGDMWNNTSPTSSVVTVRNPGYGGYSNRSGAAYIAYCFADVEGFSKFGTYTGNGSTNGPFIYTGFRPAFVMMKRTDSTSSWSMFDSERNKYNEVNELLNADVADAEYVNVGGVDFLSNGFKQRNTNSNRNVSGGTFIYMAFAENPFKTARAR